MATITSLSLSTPKLSHKTAAWQPRPLQYPKTHVLARPRKGPSRLAVGRKGIRPVLAAPDQISEKVAESIKNAEETCADDPASGECVAAWDEVEELSAAASHARDKKKAADSDPLETYCKDNPETEECRTYED